MPGIVGVLVQQNAASGWGMGGGQFSRLLLEEEGGQGRPTHPRTEACLLPLCLLAWMRSLWRCLSVSPYPVAFLRRWTV